MNTINLLSDAKYFDDSNTKLHELRAMLDSKSTKDKLDAMKKLLAMITLGRDVSAFFPDVVKNVIVDNTEVKKLVYMFLINYSEQNQDLALLSINTFQKDLTSQSQRTRAGAMKAMSSIRIPVAVPLIMLALRGAIKDQSSFVKRSAACAIPKVFMMDDDKQYTEQLIEMIAELLTSVEPIVLGSALFAYQEVCPDRFDLLHSHYRKICHLLADFDEWGQIVALDILLKYGRTQFISPFSSSIAASTTDTHTAASTNKSKAKGKSKTKSGKFYSDDDSSISKSDNDNDSDASSRSRSSDDSDVDSGANHNTDAQLDEDHQLLLRQSQTLLQSSNSGVILSVATLHWNLAPSSLCLPIVRPLVRISRNKRSIQFIVLTNLLTMIKSQAKLFESYIKDFYIFTTDALYVKQLKLEILSYLVNDITVGAVVNELSVYVKDREKTFVCLAVKCLGKCALKLPQCTEKVLHTLLKLASTVNAVVVAESIVTVRSLLQSMTVKDIQPSIIKRMVRLLDTVTIPIARAAIVWMIGEYREIIPLIAPDCLRKLAQSFKDESNTVKLQILDLSVKLFLSNPKQTSSLFKYIMDLSKYDLDYDLRDRARLLRALFFKKKTDAHINNDSGNVGVSGSGSEVKDSMKGLFLTAKPVPELKDSMKAHDKFLLGTMSHALGLPVTGYQQLTDFPPVAPDPSVRRPPVEAEPDYIQERRRRRKTDSSDESEGSDSEADDSEFSEFDSESGSNSGSDSDSRRSRSESPSASESSSDDDRRRKGKGRKDEKKRGKRRDYSSSEASDLSNDSNRSRSASGSDVSDSESSDSEDDRRRSKAKEKQRREREKEKERERAEREKKEAAKQAKEKEKSKPEEKRQKGKSNVTDLLDLAEISSLGDSGQSSITISQEPLETLMSSRSASPSLNVTSPRSSPATPFPGLSHRNSGARGQLLNPIVSGGLRIDYVFSRKPSLYGARMVDIELLCINESTAPFDDISMHEADSDNESASDGLSDVGKSELDIGDQHSTKVHVDFKGRLQPRLFTVEINNDEKKSSTKYPVKLAPPVGELLRPALVSASEWKKFAKKMMGMSEHSLMIAIKPSYTLTQCAQRIVDIANIAVLGDYDSGDDKHALLRLSGARLDNDSKVLVSLNVTGGNSGALLIHCEDFMFASALQEVIKKALA